MLEKIEALDIQCFVFLNGLGSESFDGFWLLVTKQITWIPLFILFLYLIYKKLGLKQTLILFVFVFALLTFTDQTANFFKNTFQRLRPCNNADINTFIRVVQVRNSFSFYSGHATNSMAIVTFLFLILRKEYRFFGLFFLWPLVFAYSRIYLGLHYPIDILSGYFFGIVFSLGMYKVYKILQKRYFPL
ncbi:phosphatase PAP2 family protein [Flavobacterium sp. TSSA_36]|uniref:phosphatase PAP2 family protein n=1 Tax=Flavobacterium sp. TSSA_36 TaxID=3447669 RepID=UPI003F34B88F